ncbi:hypothetical protein B0F90DRAFT_1762152 [Multifurca ochricompacta]|uniref:Uncharacterized protein n=1 Tax=Multifurca ochricompacta TaxID=376703 RepID=A0AAD4LYN0_9AGAM|nr:hypothetical protein B0F90DRAFT_1762152 [Multifurca ochricompacta]
MRGPLVGGACILFTNLSCNSCVPPLPSPMPSGVIRENMGDFHIFLCGRSETTTQSGTPSPFPLPLLDSGYWLKLRSNLSPRPHNERSAALIVSFHSSKQVLTAQSPAHPPHPTSPHTSSHLPTRAHKRRGDVGALAKRSDGWPACALLMSRVPFMSRVSQVCECMLSIYRSDLCLSLLVCCFFSPRLFTFFACSADFESTCR